MNTTTQKGLDELEVGRLDPGSVQLSDLATAGAGAGVGVGKQLDLFLLLALSVHRLSHWRLLVEGTREQATTYGSKPKGCRVLVPY